MNFICNGKTYDTDKPLYIVGRDFGKGSWYPFENGGSLCASEATVKCKKGTIKQICMDYNHGQSFVSSFKMDIPSYGNFVNSNEAIFAESPIKARKLYEERRRGK